MHGDTVLPAISLVTALTLIPVITSQGRLLSEFLSRHSSSRVGQGVSRYIATGPSPSPPTSPGVTAGEDTS